MAANKNFEMLSVKEVAGMLRMHEKTLYRKVAPNSTEDFPIKPKRVGRKVLFPKSQVMEFINSK